ncbi:MAG: AlpA family transcriptional regulator [Saccharospirillum sp.]|uniref:helix-turn-helix transcriptional regulator n=1 Tax=Saccharospirillum sp. TaxID=2033801 RepID=UPI00329A406F
MSSYHHNTGLYILRLRQVMERTGLCRSTIYAKLDKTSKLHDPTFPRQIRLGRGAVGWIESEINAWLAECVSSSRAAS